MPFESFSVESPLPAIPPGSPDSPQGSATPSNSLRRPVSMPSVKSLASLAALADASEEIQEENLSSLKEACKGVPSTGLTSTQSVFALLLGVPGAAGALLPNMMKTVGFLLAPCILFCITFVGVEAASIVSVGMDKVELTNGGELGTLRNYESYGCVVAGRLGFGIIIAFKLIILCGGCVLRMSFQTDAICALFSTDRTDFVRFMVVMPVFMAFGCVKDLVKFARFSVIGLIGTGILYLCIMMGGFLAAYRTYPCSVAGFADTSDCRRYVAFPEDGVSIGEVAIVSSVCFFNQYGVPLVASVRPKMAAPARMVTCIRMASGCLFCLYMILMSVGYYGFGEHVSEQIINDITHHSPLLGGFTAIGMIMNCAISAPLFLLIVVDTFESTGTRSVHTPLSISNLIFRFSLIFALTIISWFVPYVAEVCGIMASVMSVSLNCLFPLGLYYLSLRSGTVTSHKQGVMRYIFHGLIVLLAVSVGIFGFIGSVNKLVVKLQADSARPWIVPEDLANYTTTLQSVSILDDDGFHSVQSSGHHIY